ERQMVHAAVSPRCARALTREPADWAGRLCLHTQVDRNTRMGAPPRRKVAAGVHGACPVYAKTESLIIGPSPRSSPDRGDEGPQPGAGRPPGPAGGHPAAAGATPGGSRAGRLALADPGREPGPTASTRGPAGRAAGSGGLCHTGPGWAQTRANSLSATAARA